MILAFDLDDTLYMERDYVESAFRAIADRLERDGTKSYIEVYDVLHKADSIAKGFDAIVAKSIQAGRGVSIETLLDIYRYHDPTISLRKGARQLLERLTKRGIRLAIITDGRSRSQRNKIKALRLDSYILDSDIIISEEVGGDKTSGVPFRALEVRHPEEHHFVYVGDNPAKDFLHPNALGWNTLQIVNPDGTSIHPQNLSLPKPYLPRHRLVIG